MKHLPCSSLHPSGPFEVDSDVGRLVDKYAPDQWHLRSQLFEPSYGILEVLGLTFVHNCVKIYIQLLIQRGDEAVTIAVRLKKTEAELLDKREDLRRELPFVIQTYTDSAT